MDEKNEKSGPTFSEIEIIPIQSNDWAEKILTNELDVVCLPLYNLGFEIIKECKVIAITEIESPGRIIFCKKEFFNPAEDIKLNKGTIIAVRDLEEGIQLKHLNPLIEYKTLPHSEDVFDYFQNKTFSQAMLGTDEEIEALSDEQYHKIRLHPNEFLEIAGKNFVTFVTHRESGEVATFFRDIFHDSENLACSNVERTIAKYFSNFPDLILKVNCTKDHQNNFHLKAGILHLSDLTYQEHKMSQSTHFRLAEKMIDSLKEMSN